MILKAPSVVSAGEPTWLWRQWHQTKKPLAQEGAPR